MVAEGVPTHSISVRLQRTTTEFAYVSVPVTDDLMDEQADGTGRIDVATMVQRAIEMGGAAGVAWHPEEQRVQPHPIQAPPGLADTAQDAEPGAAELDRSVADHRISAMAAWKNVGIVVDGQPIRVHGLNPWQCEWHATGRADIELPHPSYPSQRHRMSVYEISKGTKRVIFAAGELSANVWGFYIPDDEGDGI